MKRALLILIVVSVSSWLSSCSSTSGPDEADGATTPDVSDLVAFYQFDGTLDDESANWLNAQSADDVVYVPDHNGLAGGALYVDGTVDTIWVASRGALDITDEITIAAWIRPDLCSSSYNAFVDKSLVEAYSMGVHGSANPGRTGLIFYVSDTHLQLDEGAPVGQGVWEHVACTFDDAADTLRFYVDGAFAYGLHCDTPLGTADSSLRIGSSHWGDAYKGALDQLAIFDRALTADEIEELYEFD